MPYKSRKVRNKPCFRVYNPTNKKTFSNCTTKPKSIRQMNLLRALQYNKKFVPFSRKIVKHNKTRRRK
jgi:hypothetical protein